MSESSTNPTLSSSEIKSSSLERLIFTRFNSFNEVEEIFTLIDDMLTDSLSHLSKSNDNINMMKNQIVNHFINNPAKELSSIREVNMNKVLNLTKQIKKITKVINKFFNKFDSVNINIDDNHNRKLKNIQTLVVSVLTVLSLVIIIVSPFKLIFLM